MAVRRISTAGSALGALTGSGNGTSPRTEPPDVGLPRRWEPTIARSQAASAGHRNAATPGKGKQPQDLRHAIVTAERARALDRDRPDIDIAAMEQERDRDPVVRLAIRVDEEREWERLPPPMPSPGSRLAFRPSGPWRTRRRRRRQSPPQGRRPAAAPPRWSSKSAAHATAPIHPWPPLPLSPLPLSPSSPASGRPRPMMTQPTATGMASSAAEIRERHEQHAPGDCQGSGARDPGGPEVGQRGGHPPGEHRQEADGDQVPGHPPVLKDERRDKAHHDAAQLPIAAATTTTPRRRPLPSPAGWKARIAPSTRSAPPITARTEGQDRIAWRLERDGQHRPENEDPAGECEEGCVPHQRPWRSAPFGRALRPRGPHEPRPSATVAHLVSDAPSAALRHHSGTHLGGGPRGTDGRRRRRWIGRIWRRHRVRPRAPRLEGRSRRQVRHRVADVAARCGTRIDDPRDGRDDAAGESRGGHPGRLRGQQAARSARSAQAASRSPASRTTSPSSSATRPPAVVTEWARGEIAPDEVARYNPAFRPDGVLAVLHIPTDVYFEPQQVAIAFAAEAARHGAALMPHTPVTAVRREPRGASWVSTRSPVPSTRRSSSTRPGRGRPR